MSTTVLEALEGAQINLETIGKMGLDKNQIFGIAFDQLSNAIKALNNGKGPHDIIQEHMLADVDTG